MAYTRMHPTAPYPAPRNPRHGSSCFCVDCNRFARELAHYHEQTKRCHDFNMAQMDIERERFEREMSEREARWKRPWWKRLFG